MVTASQIAGTPPFQPLAVKAALFPLLCTGSAGLPSSNILIYPYSAQCCLLLWQVVVSVLLLFQISLMLLHSCLHVTSLGIEALYDCTQQLSANNQSAMYHNVQSTETLASVALKHADCTYDATLP